VTRWLLFVVSKFCNRKPFSLDFSKWRLQFCSNYQHTPQIKLSLGEVSMWAGQHRKYIRKYEAQAWKYPQSGGWKVTFSGLGPTVAGDDVSLPLISGPLSKTNIRPNVDIVPTGNSPIAYAAPGLQFWLSSDP